jgi:N-acetylmuramoyl-L-alanine amidase
MIKELLILPLLTFHGHSVDITELDPDYAKQEITCLATNVYHEARNQGAAGQIAVASVTINRMNDDRFPNTICDVVMQGIHKPSWKGTGEMIPVRHKCHFSWYCDGKSDSIGDVTAYNEIYVLTEMIFNGTLTILDITEGATHYHADYVTPSWASTKTKTTEIQDHIFYRWETANK